MKITVISLVLVLFAVGCSRKESANAPIRVTIAHGDLASPAEIITNNYKGHTFYCFQIKFSSAKEAELCKLAQEHPNGEVEIVVGSEIAKMRMPAKALKPPIMWGVSYRSLDDAMAAAKVVKELSR
jgi:hypothetical protein